MDWWMMDGRLITRMPGELGVWEMKEMLPRMGSERRGCSWLDGGTLRTMARPKIEHLMLEHRTQIRNRDLADSTPKIQDGTSGRERGPAAAALWRGKRGGER